MTRQKGCTLVISGVFVLMFIGGSAFNIWQHDYLQAVGFLMLAAANVPSIVAVFRDPPALPALPPDNEPDSNEPAPQSLINHIATMLGFVGVLLVLVAWAI
ncbi:MAG: hypothetical protein HC876_14335 [Chloroflexaceae bacterium]|nr:hypothetical protein [Chloroflexaceae bacterium]NJO06596.1 hypothetical protein [Chloroflexaceae bacterium]NJO84400.1 hypothetical protein [Blastochloris sp.]